jgi:hypothetical protein
MGFKAEHSVEVVIDTEKFKTLLNGKSVTQFHKELIEEWGLDFKYKFFSSLVKNKQPSSWYLLYGYAIAKQLNVDITDLFTLKPKTVSNNLPKGENI